MCILAWKATDAPIPQTGVSSRVVDFLRCMDEMIVFARDHEVDLAIFAGDAFKSRSPSPTFQREFAYRVQDLAEKCPVVLLVGNHDLPSIERRASSIEIYETLNVPNVTLGREYRLHQIETRKGPVIVATAPYPMRHHLLREVDVSERRTVAEMDAALEQALVARLDALAEEASQYDMPRILTGHFTVAGSAFGSERSVMLGRDVTVMLSVLDNPAWDYVALGHIHKHQCSHAQPPRIAARDLQRQPGTHRLWRRSRSERVCVGGSRAGTRILGIYRGELPPVCDAARGCASLRQPDP